RLMPTCIFLPRPSFRPIATRRLVFTAATLTTFVLFLHTEWPSHCLCWRFFSSRSKPTELFDFSDVLNLLSCQRLIEISIADVKRPRVQNLQVVKNDHRGGESDARTRQGQRCGAARRLARARRAALRWQLQRSARRFTRRQGDAQRLDPARLSRQRSWRRAAAGLLGRRLGCHPPTGLGPEGALQRGRQDRLSGAWHPHP